MKNFRTNILLVIGFVLLFTFFQYYLTYLISSIGQNRFYEFSEHIHSLLRGLSSLAATYVSAQWLVKEHDEQHPSLFKIFGLSTCLFALFVSICYYVNRTFVCRLETSLDMLWGNLVLSFFFYHLVIAGIILAWFFFYRNQNNKLLLAQAESQKKQFELQLLQQQVEPHFLFNNLSVLAALVQHDNKDAAMFMNHFSELYRYIVRHHRAEVVSLQEELEFLHHYFYLIGQRFGSVYQLQIGKIHNYEALLPPASLQMLVENAIKHNAASETAPLQIKLEQEQDYIVVWNRKSVKQEASTKGTGLHNLQRRYSLLSNREVVIYENECTFKVSLPLLTLVAP